MRKEAHTYRMKKIIAFIMLGLSIVTIFFIISLHDFNAHKAKAVTSKANTQKTDEEPKPDFPSYNATIKKGADGLYIVTNPSSALTLVNKERRLPASYKPTDLVRPNVAFSTGKKAAHPYMKKEAAAALESLFKAAKQDGIDLFAVSAYRPYEDQETIFTENKHKEGKDKASVYSAPPGASEHQTGWAIDVTSESAKFQLNEAFGDTKEGMWLSKHAHDFGFIIRYEKGKTAITGYAYEPWHLRYVGNPYATYLYKHHLTLEEVIK
jgi:D-alanyl-D-alanine carboxypeptidase